MAESESKDSAVGSRIEIESAMAYTPQSHAETLIAKQPKRKWQSYIWDSLDKSPEERKLVFKLDCSLLILGSLGYFIKYLDQTNINNAFVSGMKEEMNIFGNELNYMQTCWSVGYVLGGLPSNMLLTRIRPSIFLPAIEVTWTVLTMCLCRCSTVQQMYVLRFFIGLFESALYPGMIYIIGSWYRSDELAKRTCIFQMSSAIGSMFSGYLMTGAYNLQGIGGMSGWRWLFILDGAISLPIAIAGFFFLPDLPEITRAWFLTKEEIALAQRRMQLEGRAGRQPYTKEKFKKIITSWRWWTLVPLYVFWNNGGASGQPTFNQYLKTSTNPVYTIPQINNYPTITGGLQIFFTLVFAWTSDSVLKGKRWPAVILGGFVNILIYISLAYWDIPVGWKWACLVLMGVGAALAGIIMSWAHEICSDDNEERAIVIGSMNQMAYVFQIWVPLLAWQQISAPQYRTGYILVTVLSLLMVVMTFVTLWFHSREIAKKELGLDENTDGQDPTGISVKLSLKE